MFPMLLALPTWIKVAAGSLLVIGLLQLQHHFEIRGLKKQVADCIQAQKDDQTSIARLELALSEVSANRDRLQQQIQTQNSAITLWQARAKTAETKATASAKLLLQQGQQRAQTLRTTPGGLGPQGLNSWLTTRFAGQ